MEKLDGIAVATACSRSASANTMFGFLPPSSSDTFLKSGPAWAITSAPVFVPPVNEMSGTFGWEVSARPALGPVPCTMFTTPGGIPASTISAASRSAVNGVSSDGFATQQFPAAMAGAIFQLSRYSGRFQGEISPATPRGCRRV